MDDLTLRDDVIEALDFEPSIDSRDIAVAVKHGVVTLSGHVRSYLEKSIAERTARGVRGVRGIAEELKVRFAFEKKTADEEIAQRAASILAWDTQVPPDAVQVKVEHGVVTLLGIVPWNYQRLAAEADVRRLSGVVAIINRIEVHPQPSSGDIKAKILKALRRDADLEADRIVVHVYQDEVRLEGSVKDWHDRQVAESAAWSAPGVRHVVDNLSISPQ